MLATRDVAVNISKDMFLLSESSLYFSEKGLHEIISLLKV